MTVRLPINRSLTQLKECEISDGETLNAAFKKSPFIEIKAQMKLKQGNHVLMMICIVRE